MYNGVPCIHNAQKQYYSMNYIMLTITHTGTLTLYLNDSV